MYHMLPSKKDVAHAILLNGSVFVHLDPRNTQVVIPERLRHQPQVVLQIGLNLPTPIPDLKIDSAGVYGTLSFKGVPFTCYVGWDAVFALVGEDAKGMVWPTDTPQEIASEEIVVGVAKVVDLIEYRGGMPRLFRPNKDGSIASVTNLADYRPSRKKERG